MTKPKDYVLRSRYEDAVKESDAEEIALEDSDAYWDNWDYPRREITRGKHVAWLPHSCSEWVIGDAVAIAALITDLRKALREIQSA